MSTVWFSPFSSLENHPYNAVNLLLLAYLGLTMANIDAADAVERTKSAHQPENDQSANQRAESAHGAFASYSLSSPELRQAATQMVANELADKSVQPLFKAPEPQGTVATPEIPALLKAPLTPSMGADQPVVPPVVQTVPIAPAEAMEDTKKTIDPCTKKILITLPPGKDLPKVMDSVKDRDPELFKQIQAKVTDPRYTGELGNITVSTHDKKGRVNGCVFEQNVPYWESGPAVQALVDVNSELAKKGKKLEADPLNGAGRTLGQEEAIVWRNSGVHARAGKSNHGYGKAEDFKVDPDAKRQLWDDPSVNATLHAHGWRQGDSYGPLKNDLHHWSFTGMGPTTDGHPPPHRKPIKHHKHR